MTPAEQLAKNKTRKAKVHKVKESKLVCRLFDIRKQLGLTLRDIETVTGIPNPSLSGWEHGFNVNLDKALILARFFGCKIEDLWRLKGSK